MPTTEHATLLLPWPRGYWAAGIHAIEAVELALTKVGRPVYVRKGIINNRHVVEDLAVRGAVFVESLQEVPNGAVIIFRAHGVSSTDREEVIRRGLYVIDATGPLVTKVHFEVIRYSPEGYSIILIGRRDHDEVVRTLGEATQGTGIICSVEEVDSPEVEGPERVAYLTQRTPGLDEPSGIVAALERRFPCIQSPSVQDICYATENRQDAVIREVEWTQEDIRFALPAELAS